MRVDGREILTVLNGVAYGSFRGVGYVNSLLTAPGITDVLDPRVVAKASTLAGYWPGGMPNSPSGNGRDYNYAAFILDGKPRSDKEIVTEQTSMREIILGASIGESAMTRYQESVPHEDSRQLDSQGEGAVIATRYVCAAKRVPAALALALTVHDSETLEPGDRLVTLYHPVTIRPTDALTELQSAIKDTAGTERL